MAHLHTHMHSTIMTETKNRAPHSLSLSIYIYIYTFIYIYICILESFRRFHRRWFCEKCSLIAFAEILKIIQALQVGCMCRSIELFKLNRTICWLWRSASNGPTAPSWLWISILDGLMAPSWTWIGVVDGLTAPSWPWIGVLVALVAPSGRLKRRFGRPIPKAW